MKAKCWKYSCLLVLIGAATVHAATFFVDAGLGDDANPGISAASAFRTVQRAIDEATLRPGPDMIQVAAGEYLENLSISDADGLTLSGSSGAVVVAADPSRDVLTISAGDVSISSLAIVGGDKGISAQGSEATAVSLSLRDVVVTGNEDDGLNAEDVVSVSIAHAVFMDNGSDGIKVETTEAVNIQATTVSDNGSDGIDLEEIEDIRLAGHGRQ